MANEALLLETLEYIKNNPQKWNQGYWFVNFTHAGKLVSAYEQVEVEEVNSCGSAFCFAGHAALKTKNFPAPPKGGWDLPWVNDDGVRVEEFARKALDLTYEQSEVLFFAENSLDDLETLVREIIEDPAITAHDLWCLIDNRIECDCGCQDFDYDYEDEDTF